MKRENFRTVRTVRFECWKVGWKCGAALMSTAQAHELASSYRTPQDFIKGWSEGRDAAETAHADTRRLLGL